MAKKMLIDATHPEETRVVVLDGQKIEDFDFESTSKRQIAGNIYLAKVTRVEPSLQAAFVEYGGNRHGFLAFSEIHPDYYQIPKADREALIAEEEAEARRLAEARRIAEEAAEAAAAARGETGEEDEESDGDDEDADDVGSLSEDDDEDDDDARDPRDDDDARDPRDDDDDPNGPRSLAESTGADDEESVTEPWPAEAAAPAPVKRDETAEATPAEAEPTPAGAVETAAEAPTPETADVAETAAAEAPEATAEAPAEALAETPAEGETAPAEALADAPAAPAEPAAEPQAAAPAEAAPDAPAADGDEAVGEAPAPAAWTDPETGEGPEAEAGAEGAAAETPEADAEDEDAAAKRRRRSRRGGRSRSRRRGRAEDDADAAPEARSADGRKTDSRAPDSRANDSRAPAEPADAETDLPAPPDSALERDTGDFMAEAISARRIAQRRYKIQEVIKVRQILLVQVVKEERGNKGAALTTYLSLAGRYCVLMPNTARGGGISRKITSAADRKKLKEIASEFEVPRGMGLIVRTAGAKRTKPEIKRDYEYLLRQWERIRETTLASVAPTLIYEEGSLIKRVIRDLYSRDIDEILVEGDEGYREAKDYMGMLMPSHARNVQPWKERTPLYTRFGVEQELESLFNPVVQLKSGGYIVIGITEALVAIDINSGKSTKEGSIEDTALKTNLEAADEIARQLKLRDLAGLIVIDFIDMEDARNNRAVEKRVKDRLAGDRARIQTGRISGFGLMEMSRQRLRPGMLEATTAPCAHCHGTGLVRADGSLALAVLRRLQSEAAKGRAPELKARVPLGAASFLFNEKREHIAEIEGRFEVSIRVEADPTLTSPQFEIERVKVQTRKPVQVAAVRPVAWGDLPPVEEAETVDEAEEVEVEVAAEAEAEAAAAPAGPAAVAAAAAEAEAEARAEDEDGRRRRGRRGGRRRRRGGEGPEGGEAAGMAVVEPEAEADPRGAEAPEAEAPEAASTPAPSPAPAPAAAEAEPDIPAPKRTRRRRKPRGEGDEAAATAEPEAATAAPEAEAAAPAEPEVEAEAPAEPTPEPEALAEAPLTAEAPAEAAAEAEATVEPAPGVEAPSEPQAEAEAPTEPAPEAAAPEAAAEAPVTPAAEPAPDRPKRRGWWSP